MIKALNKFWWDLCQKSGFKLDFKNCPKQLSWCSFMFDMNMNAKRSFENSNKIFRFVANQRIVIYFSAIAPTLWKLYSEIDEKALLRDLDLKCSQLIQVFIEMLLPTFDHFLNSSDWRELVYKFNFHRLVTALQCNPWTSKMVFFLETCSN